MGCAVALIGQKLDRRRLFRKVEKRGCGCEVELQEGANYCSRCGKAAMVETEEPIDGFSDNGEPLAVECWEPLNGGKVKFYKPRSDGSWGNVVFAYSWMAKDIPGAGFSIIPILGNLHRLEEMINEVRNALEPLGLWNEGACGFLTISR